MQAVSILTPLKSKNKGIKWQKFMQQESEKQQ